MTKFDVIVIGGGHAGTEAAAAAARLGARRRWSPTASRPSARCPAIRPSAVSARVISSARSMPSTASWASPPTGPASSSACSTAARGRRSADRGPRPTGSSIARRCRSYLRELAGLTVVEAEVDDLRPGRWPGGRRAARRRARARGRRRGHHDRDVPPRPDPHRREPRFRRAGSASARRSGWRRRWRGWASRWAG